MLQFVNLTISSHKLRAPEYNARRPAAISVTRVYYPLHGDGAWQTRVDNHPR
ncbi:MAG: hypothetical protein R3E01_00335 [Pirellulaceae bacterium]|nr:hypothetical protein [Planctomycetales bacterium]